MKFLIVDYYSSANRGDAAILEGMKVSILDIDKTAEIKVLAYKPNSVKIINGMNSDYVLIDRIFFNPKKICLAIFLYLVTKFNLLEKSLYFLPVAIRNTVNYYKDADVILSVGGGHLNDNYKTDLTGRLFGIIFAKLLKKKIILYAQSIGPFNKPLYRFFVKIILDKVDIITTREGISKQLLFNLKINKPEIYETADAAFALDIFIDDNSKESVEKKVIAEGVDFSSSNYWVSISVRRWNYSELEMDQYLTEMANFIDWLIDYKKAKIILLSTCTGLDGYSGDDRIIGYFLHKKIINNKSVYVFYNEYSIKELSYLYGKMDIHIGTRMHSCILAMLSGTPVISISYEHKSDGLFKSIELDDLIIKYDSISSEDLKIKYEKINSNIISYRSLIKSAIKMLKIKEHENRTLLLKLLNKK